MRPPRIRAALAATAVLIGAGTAMSQGSDSGVLVTLGVSTGLRVHDNLDLDPVSAGTTTRSDTRLSFGLQSRTRRQTLALDFGVLLRAEDAPGTALTARFDPNATLSYALEGADSRFSFNASVARTEVDGFVVADEDAELGTTDLIVDNGFRDRYRFGATLETGQSAPMGFVLNLSHAATRYSGTADPGLFDSTTNSGSATVLLRFSPVTEGRATVSLERYAAEDAVMTTRDSRALRFGLMHAFSETTSIDFSVGGREIVSSVTGTTRAAEAALSLTRALPRGSAGLSLSTELTSAGTRNTLQLERLFTFPAGELTVSVGAVDAAGVSLQAIGSLSYRHDLPRGAITASLARSVSVSESAAAVQLTTQGMLGLSYDVNDRSAVAFSLDYADISGTGTGAVTDRSRASLRITYRRDLTEDWALSAGYERRYLSQAGTGTAWDNAVFVTLDRVFSWMP